MLPGTGGAALVTTTVEEYVAMPGIFAEKYAVPLLIAGRALLALIETVDLPVSREDWTEVSGKAQEWKTAWKNFQDAVDEWIKATESLDLDKLTEDEQEQVRDAFGRFKGVREGALEENDATAAAFDAWTARAGAAAPDSGIAAVLQDLVDFLPWAIGAWALVSLSRR